MHIVNVMLGRGQGGIEQALVDYCEALKLEGHKVTAIISKKAKIKPALLPLGVNILEVKTLGSWDFLAKAYIKKILKQANPDAVIVHGNRAVLLCPSSKINKQRNFISNILYLIFKNKFQISNIKYKIIGVTHNYSIAPQIGLDAIIATTEDLKNKVIEAGQAQNRVFKIPNMVRIRGEEVRDKGIKEENKINRSTSIRIGTMGRFVKKKGFDVFINALAELKATGVDFEAVIGGGGEEEGSLKELAAKMELDELSFLGWVEDKTAFFNSIDIFVLPSLHEPFGIILLEAFAYKKPVVAADSEGPSEIINDGVDALLVPKDNSKALAMGISKIINDQELAKSLAQNAFAKAATYDIKHFAASLTEALKFLVKKQ